MKLRILLVCGAGMSSSLLVKFTADAAKATGEDIEVWAVARGLVNQQVGKADVCLVGPQIRFDIKAIAKELPGVPVEMIEMKSYGTMNGKAIIQQAKALYEKSKA